MQVFSLHSVVFVWLFHGQIGCTELNTDIIVKAPLE